MNASKENDTLGQNNSGGSAAIRDAIGTLRVNGLSIRYARGGRSSGTPILLSSPWPESLFAFRGIWRPLAEHAPLIAVDLPGFGASESRPDLLSVDKMADFLVALIRQLDLKQVHVVAPDVGTSASLLAAYRHGEVFASLVVGSGLVDLASATGNLKRLIDSQPQDSPFGDGVICRSRRLCTLLPRRAS